MWLLAMGIQVVVRHLGDKVETWDPMTTISIANEGYYYGLPMRYAVWFSVTLSVEDLNVSALHLV
jgi:hypothetical protein